MHHAAQKGKHIRLRSFMSGDVNALNKGATSLYLAASNGHLRCVTMLLDAKADVNALSNGKTPLMGASSYDHLKVVNALIKARADVNILSNDHGTALFYAACEKTDGHTIVAALLAAGAIVDAPGTMMSPLSTAVRSNSMKSFKLLIAAGADVDGLAYTTTGTPLSMATLCGNVTAVKLLLDAKADIKSARGIEFSLLYAVSEGSVELTKLYIAAGADVNTRRHDNYTCLHELVKQCLPSGEWARKEHSHEEYPIFADKFNATPFDYPGVFQVLIDAKADVSAQGSSNCETPLHVAAHLNNVQAVTALLAAGASPDDATGQDLSAILMAANSGFLGVVTALISAGADVNRVDNDGGGSPVFIAAAGHDHSHLGIVSALIAAGADVNCVTHKGFTPVLIATAHGNPKIVSALIAARANVNYISHNPDHMFAEVAPLEIALGKNYNEIASILKAAGDLTWEGIMTRTNPLFMITGSNSNGDDVSLKYHLIGRVSATDKENALKLGVFMRNLILVKCMLAAGVNASLRFRARDLLCWASAWGHADIVKALLDAGADITFKDHEGMTALQLAVRGKHLDVLVLLLTRAYELRKKK